MTLEEIEKNKELILAKKIFSDQYIKKEPEFIPVWKLIPNFMCPLIGSCLTIEEQRKIVKKAIVAKKRMSDFEAHHALMEYIGTENPVSVKTDRYIRRKYKTIIENWKDKSEKELSASWKSSRKTGDMAGIFYVIATRTDISTDLKMIAFGDIHMMGHSNMFDIMKARKALAVEKEANQKLVERLNDERLKTRQLNTINKQQQKKITGLETENAGLTRLLAEKAEKMANETAPDADENRDLKERLLRTEETLAAVSEENEQTLRYKTKLEKQYAESETTCNLIKEELFKLITQKMPDGESCCPQQCHPELCDACELCPKKVLMIGGMTKMKPFYRDIVESGGNEFVYHDGYMKNRTRQLNDLVSGSDLVLCPVNCNSHNACLKIKKLCKKYNTPYKMMPCSSLSSVSRAVNLEQSA